MFTLRSPTMSKNLPFWHEDQASTATLAGKKEGFRAAVPTNCHNGRFTKIATLPQGLPGLLQPFGQQAQQQQVMQPGMPAGRPQGSVQPGAPVQQTSMTGGAMS